MPDKHINLEPRNEQGEPHGYWDIYWFNDGWYKGHYINGLEFGSYEIDWKKMVK